MITVSRQVALSIAMLFICICISGCMNSKKYGSDETRLISIYSNFCNNGELFLDEQNRLNFFDFISMQSAIICPRPNCPHTEANGCSSLGMDDCPFIYNGHIYYFNYETKYVDSKPVWVTNLYRADIDGTNRVKINSFEGLQIMYYDRLFLCGDKLYFAPLTVSYEENRTKSGLSEAKLCSYSFSENKIREIYNSDAKYGMNSYIYGAADGCIYFGISYCEYKISYEELENLLSGAGELAFESEYYKYNIADGSLSECDPSYKPIYGGYLCHFKDEGATLYLPCGDCYIEDMTSNAYDVYDIMAAGDYVFDFKDGFAINIKNLKKQIPNLNKAESAYYVDGFYIFKIWDLSGEKWVYKKLSEDELFDKD